VFEMRIPADLVVLSACESVRGKVVRGEGLRGLVQSFAFAGAPRVIASLWRVEDVATAALMKEFYAAWRSGMGAAASLKEAQARVREQESTKHPRHWAAWVLWGVAD
jgi:CHAT domain-containing protein